MQITIGDIAEQVPIVSPSTKCEDVYSVFNEVPSLEGIVVCTDNEPVGLVMKSHFYQKLSIKYGFDLFMKRTIELVMNKEPLIVDSSVHITEVSALAMHRDQENLYDYVIVTAEDRIFGIVSIKNLLIKLAEVQVSNARYSNPLTGLPGNYEIIDSLQETLTYEKYSVLYIDINSFKVFNDTFGFKHGDEVIQETANIISETIITEEKGPSFVGHIGGDDFIAIVPHFHYKDICYKIITRFDHLPRRFYSNEELTRGYVRAINRKGIMENIPIIGLSIAVVQNKNYSFHTIEELSKEAAKLKKKCKGIKRSVFLTFEDCEEESNTIK